MTTMSKSGSKSETESVTNSETNSEQVLTVEKEESIAWLKLNRPKVMNCLNRDLLKALLAACEELKEDRNIRVVGIIGSGTTVIVLWISRATMCVGIITAASIRIISYPLRIGLIIMMTRVIIIIIDVGIPTKTPTIIRSVPRRISPTVVTRTIPRIPSPT